MHLLLTSVLPFLAHDHPSAVAFLTCRHHNFHASIIPEFLSDEERVKSFCRARQQNELEGDGLETYSNFYNLFVQTPLMQFSPALMLLDKDCTEPILKPLLETKYFTRSLQRCCVQTPLWYEVEVSLTNDLFQGLSTIRSLTKLDLGESEVKNHHLEIIVNFSPSLETLTIDNARCLDYRTAISLNSPLPPATKTLRSLELRRIGALFATQFVPYFPNLRTLDLFGQSSHDKFDLLSLSSSLPLLIDLSVGNFTVKNTESLKNLVHLSSLRFKWCEMADLSFLSRENSLPRLTTLRIDFCHGFSFSQFASLSHAPNLQVLEIVRSEFDNDCLEYLENMVDLRKLDLGRTNIAGDGRALKMLMQNLFQLEELNLERCNIGKQGAVAGALYSTHSRLRVLNLDHCNFADHDLNGISALKNTLEVLDLSCNYELTTEGLMHFKDLVKLKSLKLERCFDIDDLSPLKDCLNLEELGVSHCDGLTDDSFKVFSEEPNSFRNLRALDLSENDQLTEISFQHLSKSNHVVYRLKELTVKGMGVLLSSSPIARNNIYQLKGLRRLEGIPVSWTPDGVLLDELLRNLKNLDVVGYETK